MGTRIFLASALMLLTSMAFAEHAISLEPEAAPVAAAEPAAEPPAAVPEPIAEAQTAAPAPSASAPVVLPAPKVEVNVPAEHDLYVVPAATRQVCTTREWGFGEIQTDCRMQPVPVRAEDPALRGLCITRYGRRLCY